MKYIAALWCALLLVSCSLQEPEDVTPVPDAPSPASEDIVMPTQDILVEEIAYYPDLPDVKGYLARPDGEGPYPALILIHEWWGLNDNIRDFAERFAREGYVAFAVDLYDGQVATTSEEAGALATRVRENTSEAFANLQSAVSYLSTFPEVKADALGSVGWCFGGGWAYQMAKNDLGVDATVMYYGQFDPEGDFAHMKASILGHFGEEDRSISVDDVEKFRVSLSTSFGNHAIYIYPNAGHAFANEDNEAAYNPEAAALSWQRTLEFLKEEIH